MQSKHGGITFVREIVSDTHYARDVIFSVKPVSIFSGYSVGNIASTMLFGHSSACQVGSYDNVTELLMTTSVKTKWRPVLLETKNAFRMVL